MNDANKEKNAAYEEPKKKVYVKLLVFLVLITAIVVVLGAKFVSFYYKTHGIGGRYFYKGCDAEVVHQLPEGLTDEDISNAVIMRTYNRGEAMYEGSIRETIPSELADLIFSDEETEIKKTITDETEEKVKVYYDTDEVA